MKNEADFCVVVKHSLINGYKIPDPNNLYSSTSKRVFDGIGSIIFNNELKFVCWEAKYLKKPSAFNFNRIEEHQSYYLSEYSKTGVLSFLILCVNYGRADKRVFIFKWDNNMDDLYKSGFSIHLKNLNKLPYNKINKNTFLFENIIDYNMLNDIFKLH